MTSVSLAWITCISLVAKACWLVYSDKKKKKINFSKKALVQCKLHLMKHAWMWYSGPDGFSPPLFSLYMINNCIDNEWVLALMLNDSFRKCSFLEWSYPVQTVSVVLEPHFVNVFFLPLHWVANAGKNCIKCKLKGKRMHQEKNCYNMWPQQWCW